MATTAPGGQRVPPLASWESIVVDAVGEVIEFWGFKRNQGRVWALLYLRGRPMRASELKAVLDLSKGGVSMLLADLERWGVVIKEPLGGAPPWRYRAQTDLVRMVTHVIEHREAGLIERIRAELERARREARGGDADPDQRRRLDRMTLLAEQTDRALKLFVKTAKLDVGGMLGVWRSKWTRTTSK